MSSCTVCTAPCRSPRPSSPGRQDNIAESRATLIPNDIQPHKKINKKNTSSNTIQTQSYRSARTHGVAYNGVEHTLSVVARQITLRSLAARAKERRALVKASLHTITRVGRGANTTVVDVRARRGIQKRATAASACVCDGHILGGGKRRQKVVKCILFSERARRECAVRRVLRHGVLLVRHGVGEQTLHNVHTNVRELKRRAEHEGVKDLARGCLVGVQAVQVSSAV